MYSDGDKPKKSLELCRTRASPTRLAQWLRYGSQEGEPSLETDSLVDCSPAPIRSLWQEGRLQREPILVPEIKRTRHPLHGLALAGDGALASAAGGTCDSRPRTGWDWAGEAAISRGARRH